MWNYEKLLQYPVKITRPDPNAAALIVSQIGGPNGELGASLRYLSQRYTMKNGKVAGLLTDIGTEELGHMEMVSAIIHQLTKNLTPEQIKNSAFAPYYVDHTTGIWPAAASGSPFTADMIQSVGDPISDLHEDMAAEQKARTTYENLLRVMDNPEVIDPLRFLREREIVHFQRFGEAEQSIWNDYDGVADNPLEIKENLTSTYSSTKGQPRLYIFNETGLFVFSF